MNDTWYWPFNHWSAAYWAPGYWILVLDPNILTVTLDDRASVGKVLDDPAGVSRTLVG